MTIRILLLAAIAATHFVRCDSANVSDVGSRTSDSRLLEAARTFYDDALADGAKDLDVLVRRRPPDWSSALVIHRLNGLQVVATHVSGGALRAVGDTLSSMGMIVFEVGRNGNIQSATRIELVTSGAASSTDMGHYLTSYWREEFSAPFVAVAEFSVHYEHRDGHVFYLDEEPRAAQVNIEAPGTGKRYGVDDTCYYVIWCYQDPDSGGLLYCERSSIYLLFCDSDYLEEDGGGSGGSGGDSDDSCSCTETIPCEMEAEYASIGVTFTQSCSDFVTTGGSANFSWSELNGHWAGGNESDHSPWGYISGTVVSQMERMRSVYGGPITLSSGYRCPIGNTAIGSDHPTTSEHMRGTAVDISTGQSYTVWEELYRAAESLNPSWISDWGTYPKDRHLHVTWEKR